MMPFQLPTADATPHLGETDSQDISAWLRLANASGLPPIALRALLAEFGGPQAVLNQPFNALAAIAGEKAALAVLGSPPRSELGSFEECLARTLEWASVAGNTIVTLANSAYPPALLTMPDPPPLLYVKGRLDLLQARAVAIVGSRSATPQGIEDARRFAQALSDAGLAVVSGLALGIDGAAHRGGLSGSGGTIAVIGTGADLVYPSLHHALAHEIAKNGAIVSEWPLGTPARPANFPQRNRLIAGLVSGVLVVEAAMRSGSLITARLANEMGRDVFARCIRDSRIDPRAAVARVSSDDQAGGEARGDARGYSRGVRFSGPERSGGGSRFEATKAGESTSSGGGQRRPGIQRICAGTSNRVSVRSSR